MNNLKVQTSSQVSHSEAYSQAPKTPSHKYRHQFIPLENSPGVFTRGRKLWKTLWEKEANAGQYFLLLPCFLLYQKQIQALELHLISLEGVITPSQTIHFRLFQTERVCRRQF